MKDFIEKKILPPTMRFVNSSGVVAIRDGFVATMALTIVGSIFLLLANFPYIPVQNWLTEIGVRPVLLQAYDATFNILGLIAVFSIGYSYAKHKGVEPLHAGILSTVCYILLMEFSVTSEETKEVITGVIPFAYLGSKGMIASIILGLTAGSIYSWFVEKDITIKMPAGVPSGVANSFASVIPGAVIITGATVLYAIFRSMGTTFIDFIYTLVQLPLQGLTSSFIGAILIAFAMNFLWWFGIHGSSIVAGIMAGVLTANMNANQLILDAGQVLTAANGHIVTYNFRTMIMIITGSGITIGAVLFMVFFAKSQQYKRLGKLALGSSLFNINEPILFGTPMVLNPLLAIPFIGVPIVATMVSYLAMASGLVPLMGAINPPWTTPPIISGFLVGGWRLALLQVVVIAISFFGYFPFIRKQDRLNLMQEKQAEAQE